MKTPAVVLLTLCGVLLAAWPAAAASPSLKGLVGPGDTISVSSKPTRAGTYRIAVRDRSDEHNFRLRGAGVNVATGVESTGTKTFVVRLKPGKTYTFQCDPHADEMRGSFRVRA
jgi:hypothetical protein